MKIVTGIKPKLRGRASSCLLTAKIKTFYLRLSAIADCAGLLRLAARNPLNHSAAGFAFGIQATWIQSSGREGRRQVHWRYVNPITQLLKEIKLNSSNNEVRPSRDA